jgi:hypothetical protein
MATTPVDDDFDMPDLTDEMLIEFKPLTELAHTDLHMGSATVAPVKKAVAKPFDLGSIIANAAVGAGYLSAGWLFVQVWAWVLSS